MAEPVAAARGEGAAIGLSESRYLMSRPRKRIARELPAPELARFSQDAIAFAVRAWTMKAEEEYASAAVFSELLAGLIDGGAPLDLTHRLSQIIGDELAHAELCQTLSVCFGAPAPHVRLATVRTRVGNGQTLRRPRMLALALVEGAIGETVSSSLFAAGRRCATEPCTRAALSAILRDEVLHARFFWEALTALWPSLEAAERESLQREAARAFASLEAGSIMPALRRVEKGTPFDPAWAHLGVLSPALRVDAFYRVVDARVVPSLTRLGLDGVAAWRDRYHS